MLIGASQAWRTLARACAFGAMVMAGPVAADPNLRVLVIDDDFFALIDDRTDRHRAIDDMLGDIEQIVAAASSPSIETLVLYHEGYEISQLRNVDSGRNFLSQLRESWLVRDMRTGPDAGSHTGAYGIDIYALRAQMFDILRNKRMHRLRDGETRQIDMHVFGNTWYRNAPNGPGNMLTHKFAGLCYQNDDQGTRDWPDEVTLAVEFRPPATYEIPHERALLGFMTILAGSSAANGPVMMRGSEPKGPACGMSDQLHAFTDPDFSNTDPDLCSAPSPVSGYLLQQRCETTDHPAIGTGLNESPIHLVSRSDAVIIGTFNLSTTGPGVTAQIATGVAGPVLSPGGPQNAPTMGGLRANGTLQFLPLGGPSCTRSGVIEADLSSGGTSVQVVASRGACLPTTLEIGEVVVQ